MFACVCEYVCAPFVCVFMRFILLFCGCGLFAIRVELSSTFRYHLSPSLRTAEQHSIRHTTNVAAMPARFLALACLLGLRGALGETASEAAAANPIRKVVNLLQAMQKKVTEEGAKAEDLHKKFTLHCSGHCHIDEDIHRSQDENLNVGDCELRHAPAALAARFTALARIFLQHCKHNQKVFVLYNHEHAFLQRC